MFLPGGRPIAASGNVQQAVAEAAETTSKRPRWRPRRSRCPTTSTPCSARAGCAPATNQPYKTSDRGSTALHALPSGLRVERLEGVRGGRIQVRDPGRRQDAPGHDRLGGRARPGRRARAHVARAAAGVPGRHGDGHLRTCSRRIAPSSTAAPYAEANCGPTTVGMALDAFGISVPSRQLRAEALDAQHMYGNGVGTLITALATGGRRTTACPWTGCTTVARSTAGPSTTCGPRCSRVTR